MSTRTRRQQTGETRTKEQRRKDSLQAKLAAAKGPAARFAVHADWFRSSVEWMVKRHTRYEAGVIKVVDPRAEEQADALYAHAGDFLRQLAEQIDGRGYDQPSR